MNTPAGRRSTLLLMALLLLLAVTMEQLIILPFLPMASEGPGICPMIVFLDIPLRMPVTIDLIPVSILFLLFYTLFLVTYFTRQGVPVGPAVRKQLWGTITGWGTLLICLSASGGIFYLAQDYLSRAVKNGIDSFGVRTDLVMPYPSGETIHLHGSMIGFLGMLIGGWVLHKRSALPIIPPKSIPIPVPATTQKPATTQQQTAAQQQAAYGTPPPPPPVLVKRQATPAASTPPQPVQAPQRPAPVQATQRPAPPAQESQRPAQAPKLAPKGVVVIRPTRARVIYPCVMDGEVKPAAAMAIATPAI